MVKKVLSEYFKYLKNYPKKERFLQFIWHGGEPLLMGVEWFEKVFELQRQMNKKNYPIYNSIQTNGTLLNQKWIDFFKKNNVFLGISLDGPKFVNDIYRKDKKDKSVFNKIMNSVDLLNKNKVLYSVLSVITDENYKYSQEIIEFFNTLQGLKYVDFLPGFDSTNNKVYLNVGNYAKFLKEVNMNQNRKFEVRFLDDIKTKVLGKCSVTSIGCEFGGACGQMHFITKDGDMYPCVTLPIIPGLKMGNINTNTLQECLDSDNFKSFKKRYAKVDDKCLKCEHANICRAGCAARREIVTGFGKSNLDFYCVARKNILNILKKPL